MPQNRRKVPFSGKAKKEQLKKKHSKNVVQNAGKKTLLVQHSDDGDDENKANFSDNVRKLNYQAKGDKRANKYVLQFFRETDEEMKLRKEEAKQTLKNASNKDLEVIADDYFPSDLEFPQRPPWSFDMSAQQLESKEQKYFSDYIRKIEEKYSWKDLSYFDLNLETWRQLWRVLEMSDIVLYIVDIRYSALMFPPSLYTYVTETLKKDFILVLNKIDLAEPPLVAAWKNYFQEKYPSIHVVMFTTLPAYNLVGNQNDKGGLQIRRRKGRIRMAAEGTQLLYDVCKKIAQEHVDLSSWQDKIKEEMSEEFEDDFKTEIGETKYNSADTSYVEHERYKDGVLTIGCLGHPNVGKSSLMNAIMGKKVVSVSKTPGHTKHFQTIFLTPNVKLCDCPGLVFPSKVPKYLQVLMGCFPIAQFREPYSSIKYLAEHLDLPKLLRIDHPDHDDTWSAMDICEGWAKKRGYFTAKAARLDPYRAANYLLRMALDGKICLCLRPPEYNAKEEFWNNHPDVELVKWIQAKIDGKVARNEEEPCSESDLESNLSERQSSDSSEADLSSEDEESEGTSKLQGDANKFALLADL